MEEKKFNAKKFAIILIVVAVVMVCAIYFFLNSDLFNFNQNVAVEIEEPIQAEEPKKAVKNEYALTDNNFSKFDFSFLKFENEKENKIYSPLSIKYAFKMLEEATSGNAKEQLSEIVGKYDLTKYKSNKNMAFANAFFVRDSYKDNVKNTYIDLLKNKYDADVQFDSFDKADNINNWVSKNTLGLIDELYTDEEVSDFNFALVNSLGIDMEWKHKFLDLADDELTSIVDYYHEDVFWEADNVLSKIKFNTDQDISSMKVIATLNNYDIVKELGEDSIKQTVKEAFIKWATTPGGLYGWDGIDEYEKKDPESYTYKFFNGDFSDAGIEKAFDKYWNPEKYSTEFEYATPKGYLEEIKENYGKVDYSVDFSLYTDDNVKVFAKDLKEYDGTTLQYVGIMPIKEDLDKYIDETSEEEIKDLIKNVKDLKLENFKDGVLTKITGYIPKFKFDYELENVQKDLERLGITDVFESGKANLTELTDDKEAFIGHVKHKATIEFTENGIKAAATTGGGGYGGGGFFDYIFDVPTEEIDITFDKPYMFIIRDKDTGETWFVGTVYNPLDAKDEVGYICDAIESEEQ